MGKRVNERYISAKSIKGEHIENEIESSIMRQ